jgi:hypothetical protein
VSNIIIPGGGGGNWQETPGERSLRQMGHRTSQNAIMETGVELGADELRKENAGASMKKIGKALWELRQAMADQGWDDDKVMVVIGIQARNGWARDCEGQWQESGSQATLDKLAAKAKRDA